MNYEHAFIAAAVSLEGISCLLCLLVLPGLTFAQGRTQPKVSTAPSSPLRVSEGGDDGKRDSHWKVVSEP